MKRSYYADEISRFLKEDPDRILGLLVQSNEFALESNQKDAWNYQIANLQENLRFIEGKIYFEYAIPRMGKRVDVVLLIQSVVFVLEYKVGETHYPSHALDQVTDYALDLKNFHETSHDQYIVPMLIASNGAEIVEEIPIKIYKDKLLCPLCSNGKCLNSLIRKILESLGALPAVTPLEWEEGSYRPTPTIIEAAMALYGGHSVAEISRSDASGEELHRTTRTISELIARAKAESFKAICFVTGVPGAGKTLIGLNVATQHFDKKNDMYSVFLSGNGPLVKVLQEALARDKVAREKLQGKKYKKRDAYSEVKMFVQNVHHYRDECLRDAKPPVDHVALFDEAQRAWNLEQTCNFMQRKKGQPNFNQSEPEFLLSCIDRHQDWGIVVCLVGGGQEINTGEAGISEWVEALNRAFPDWRIYISDRLQDEEFGAGKVLEQLKGRPHVEYNSRLHLSVSMRSYRAENVSQLVKQILDRSEYEARESLAKLAGLYPIVLTRDMDKAKNWLRENARGTERIGVVVSSKAIRLKPLAIDVRFKPDPVHWFLAGKKDIRSSYYLEDVATEFDIQGLELDWACVTWDADFRYGSETWSHHLFRGEKWLKIKKAERQIYLKNAYRVLLTRARQGMVIVVPEGNPDDPTRLPKFYDTTFNYLSGLKIKVLD